MKIGGFQKFSLLDYPGYLAAIIFTQGCNFRCPYCHNPQLVDEKRYEPLLDTEWVLRFLYRRRKKLGAVVLTGGEPTLQDDLIPVLKLIKAMRFKIKLDTNGSRPALLKEISDMGLVDYFAMDIKAPLPLYHLVTRSNVDSQQIMASMEVVRHAGIPYEFRSTYFDALMGTSDLLTIQELLKPGDRFILQECRYGDNLEKIDKPSTASLGVPFDESETCRQLEQWGHENHVLVSVRSL